MLDVQPNGKSAHRFWQRGGGYDRNITEPETVWAEIAYIHSNPVRRGLCERPEEWYWSSAADYLAIGSGPLSLDRGSLPRTSAG
jgi:putative transposase